MLGKLPPEIAKLIHVYVFEDVLKELLYKTYLLLENTEFNFLYKFDAIIDIIIFNNGLYGIIYENGYSETFQNVEEREKLYSEKLIHLKQIEKK